MSMCRLYFFKTLLLVFMMKATEIAAESPPTTATASALCFVSTTPSSSSSSSSTGHVVLSNTVPASKPRLGNMNTPLQNHFKMKRLRSRNNNHNNITKLNSQNPKKASTNNTNTNTNISKIMQNLQKSIQLLNYGGQLWFLTILSILSGLSPAVEIISSSHISRLPDCPIAHDIDTMLLWPAIAGSSVSTSSSTSSTSISVPTPPWTIFQTPSAAITDESMYDVNWSDVIDAFVSNVEISFLFAFIVSLSIVMYLDNE